MKNILVPTDFSTASRNAANYAVSLAGTFDATLTLVNIVSPPIIIDDSILASVMITQAEILEANTKLMEQEIAMLSKKYTAITGLVKEGLILDIIPELVAEKQANLVVMGMKGKGKSNSVFGSTTTALTQKCSFPIFVIPENATFKSIEKITYASDFNTDIESARYATLFDITDKFNAEINILHVQKKRTDLKAAEAIGKMKASLAFSKHKHQFHTIAENNVEEGITKFIEQNHSDVLTMVAHKHSLFDRLFGKVHTKAMSYQTRIPLLVLQSK